MEYKDRAPHYTTSLNVDKTLVTKRQQTATSANVFSPSYIKQVGKDLCFGFAILGGTEGKTRDNTGRTERLTNSSKKVVNSIIMLTFAMTACSPRRKMLRAG